MTMDSNVVSFPGSSPKRGKPVAMAAGTSCMSRVDLDQEIPAREEGETITLRNRNLRDARKDAWSQAETISEYWRARLDMESAIGRAQSHDLPEGNNHPRHHHHERLTLVVNWREAIVQQLLTPAPDTKAIAWKRAKVSGRRFSHLPVKPERVERAIADDVAFLDAHPTRTKKGRGADR